MQERQPAKQLGQNLFIYNPWHKFSAFILQFFLSWIFYHEQQWRAFDRKTEKMQHQYWHNFTAYLTLKKYQTLTSNLAFWRGLYQTKLVGHWREMWRFQLTLTVFRCMERDAIHTLHVTHCTLRSLSGPCPGVGLDAPNPPWYPKKKGKKRKNLTVKSTATTVGRLVTAWERRGIKLVYE